MSRDSVYSNNQSVSNSMRTGGGYSSLLSDQVYNKHGRTGGSDPYKSSNEAYSKKQDWKKSSVYEDTKEYHDSRKYKRFNDLKLLNEQMINLANNLQPSSSPLEVLSQGQKGEIKDILMYRITKLSFVPLLFASIVVLNIIFIDSFFVTFMLLVIFVYVAVKILFYPAKLYYENVQYKTTKHAVLFYEEMDFWFKLSVANSLVSLFVLSIVSFVVAFYEERVVEVVLNLSKYSSQKDVITNYAANISFSYSLTLFSLSIIAMILFYFRFINYEYEENEKLKKQRSRDIENETVSRVRQIQKNK
jgi:hypothetical protein